MLCKRIFNKFGGIMEEEAIKIVSAELLKGAKMLPTHCSKCGYPLFEKDGKIYCPICEKLKNKEVTENQIETKIWNESSIFIEFKKQYDAKYKL